MASQVSAKVAGWTLAAVLVVVSTVFLGFVGLVASVAMVLLVAFVPGCGLFIAAAIGLGILFWQLGTEWGALALILGLIGLFVFAIVDNVRQGRPWYATPEPPKRNSEDE